MDCPQSSNSIASTVAREPRLPLAFISASACVPMTQRTLKLRNHLLQQDSMNWGCSKACGWEISHCGIRRKHLPCTTRFFRCLAGRLSNRPIFSVAPPSPQKLCLNAVGAKYGPMGRLSRHWHFPRRVLAGCITVDAQAIDRKNGSSREGAGHRSGAAASRTVTTKAE